MTELGIDYSWGRPSPSAIAAEGFSFVMRYLDYPGAGAKAVRRPEVDNLHSAGISVGFCFESTADRASEGRTAGVEDAQSAALALFNLGAPSNIPVYFAVDFDAQPNQLAQIFNYFGGIKSILPILNIGVYGSYNVVDYCQKNSLAAYFWQTYAWSGGQKHPYRHIYQYQNAKVLDGADVDYDEAYGESQGLWEPKENNVPLTAEELNAALQQRMKLTTLANNPDINKVNQAVDILTKAGLL